MKTNFNADDRCSSLLSARRMLAWAILLGNLGWLPQVRAQQALPFYEPFPNTYTIGEELGQNNPGTAVFWNTGNSISSSCARVENYAALEYPGLTNIDATAQSYGLASYPKDASSTKCRAVLLAIPTNTTLYASCLLNIQYTTNAAAQQPGQAFFGLSPTAAVGSSVSQSGAVVYFNQAGQLLISKNSTTPATNATYSLTMSNTYLLVLRYKYNTGSPDQVDLWVNPTSLGNDSTVPPPTITTTNNANVTTFGSVAYYQFAQPGLCYLDEIRVATNWSGVTPTTPAPGNLYSVTGGGVGCAGASFNVGLGGSDSGVSYLLYTNGVFTGQSVDGTGTAVSFGLQNVTGIYTVLATNPATANVGWMNTNATVSVTPAPNIAAQPASALVATNALAGFFVSSSGNGLSYQWYRNGVALTNGAEFSGVLTTNLTISPATTADVATVLNGYYVKVSNPCGGFIYSTTNALTLDAPANLVWYGDGVSNLWDVVVSTNWNFDSDTGYPTNVFNFGDNVTFDDTSGNTTVVLANADLSPSSITVNGSGGQNYTFSGSGALAGNGWLLMNSLGTLNLAIQNNETGGLVISNGSIAFSTTAALGSGAITLAGGGLVAPGTGLITVTNTINITGSNSFISANSAGGQPLVLTGPFNGISGSVVFSNSTTRAATATIQLTGTNLTINLPVDLNVGAISGGYVNVSGNNTSGTQIWNSLITDGGEMQRNASGGTTLLNNTNTFSGGTKLSNGRLGVGSDSISIVAPPAVDAGPLGTGTFYIDTGNNSMQLFASGGPHIIGNVINWASTNFGAAWIINGSNNLTLTGAVDLGGTNRVIQTDNTGLTVLSGVITDDGNVLGVTKTGNGVLYLDGANLYTGVTTNSAGTLAGSGSLSGPLVVQSGATIGAGDAGTNLGTFTVNSDLMLSGNVLVRVNAQTNDNFAVSGMLTNAGAGTLTVNNLGPALTIGATFTVFSEAVSNGAALTVTGGGMNWTNLLAVDGSIQALGPAATFITNSPAITSFSLSGGNVVITGTNGQAGATCYLLNTTNLTKPRSQWKTVATNVLGGNAYTFIGTNAVTPGSAQQFFMLSSTNYNP